jgi:hypothetical protein
VYTDSDLTATLPFSPYWAVVTIVRERPLVLSSTCCLDQLSHPSRTLRADQIPFMWPSNGLCTSVSLSTRYTRVSADLDEMVDQSPSHDVNKHGLVTNHNESSIRRGGKRREALWHHPRDYQVWLGIVIVRPLWCDARRANGAMAVGRKPGGAVYLQMCMVKILDTP